MKLRTEYRLTMHQSMHYPPEYIERLVKQQLAHQLAEEIVKHRLYDERNGADFLTVTYGMELYVYTRETLEQYVQRRIKEAQKQEVKHGKA